MSSAAISTSPTAGRNRILFLLIAILSLAGVVVSAVALQRHYAKSATEFCDLNQKFNCDIVNRSEESTIVGIPVAGIGVLGYAAIFWLATFARSQSDTPLRLLVVAIVGFLFALRLTYVEAYVLDTWCILCVTSQILIFLILVLAIPIKLRSAKP
ncbi:MAG TPA: vitamin K epoxide reductase family protein [Candidatus Sulfotelmatobacter sp.]|nr:vitamin K epoxide reductase family protein [Candidatus Sulfotelmatobacter sp.]